MTKTLAVHGGTPIIDRPLALFQAMGEDEVEAASRVVRSGVLSAFIGAPGEFFLGGPEVRAFEDKAARHFGVKHAISVNSWTSGLIAAVGAAGIAPGDEVITTPWTMSATAMAILHWNAIPVFADIDPVSFNIDPASVESLVGPRTKAIMAVDIFGQSADMQALRAVADRHGLSLLTDTAQAPGARTGNRFTGTLADIGGFSLNYHKHIHCGEGGILVTDDDRLAERLQLIRNHAESVLKSDDPADYVNMIGYNFRMGEIEAAIAAVQLDKLKERVESRQRAARQLDEGLAGLAGLTTPQVGADATHVYYVYGMILDTQALGVSRAKVVEALQAEGVPGLFGGYQNLHLLPIFRHRIAYGRDHFPWTLAERDIAYGPGTCPVAEKLHSETFMGINLCMCDYPPEDVDAVVSAFRKVWGEMDSPARRVTMPPTLTGKLVRLDRFLESDIGIRYIGWLNDIDVVRYSNQRFRTHDRDSCATYLASFEDSLNLFLSIRRLSDGAAIGTMTAYRNRHHRTADVGIMIGEKECWGGGFGQDAWDTLVGWLLGEGQARKVTAGTLDCNVGMVRLMERSGMVREGVRREQELVEGTPRDVLLYGKFAR